MKTALFKIDGMRCNGCATPSNPSSSGNRACRRPRSHVTRAKQGILYDPETIAEERLVATVQKLGPSKTSKPIQEGVLKILRVPSPSISEKFSAGGSRVSGIHGQPEPDDVEIEERKAMAAASVPELYLDSVNPRAWQ